LQYISQVQAVLISISPVFIFNHLLGKGVVSTVWAMILNHWDTIDF